MSKTKKKENWFTFFLPTIIALIIAGVLKTTVIANVKVPTGSMKNTIMEGDRLIVNRLAYKGKDVERYDIVVFHPPDAVEAGDNSLYYVKRVIGLPNETIQIKDGIVYKVEKDGSLTELESDFVRGSPYGDFGPYEIPENSYFMLGDNRNESEDARFWNIKYVKKDMIIGKAVFRYMPNPSKLSMVTVPFTEFDKKILAL